jgi:type III restriction enzyme
MPRARSAAHSGDSQRFLNEDLVLEVSAAVDRTRWDEDRYDAFIELLCGDREYQKDAIRTALRFLLGGEYGNLRALAESNFRHNEKLGARYGSWDGMQRHLQFPDHLSATLDLATGTGKSYVMYSVAAIMLAEGAVDRVLVLCPSTTIEDGLTKKFRELATDGALRDLLPANAAIANPAIINASESITAGSICIENYHATLESVRSSIRDSLTGKGGSTLVLNDEAHHVANEPATQAGKWKEFLSDATYGFRYILGVSGTPYVKDNYFADVIYRYSLRQAMEEGYVKRIEYVVEAPQTNETNEKWQLIHNRHDETKSRLARRNLLPLTIIVTQTIEKCRAVTEELRAFLCDAEGLEPEDAAARVLCVYNNAPDVRRLPYVDNAGNRVEWIVSVSMLAEGWDVKRVFQIVPHEERAFNSKLLIAQVLGRALRIPDSWGAGERPTATVFNHDAWAPRIRHLVNEVLEMEKRISARVVPNSPYHFDLHQIDYTLEPITETKAADEPLANLKKGYIDLRSDVGTETVSTVIERAGNETQYRWQTEIRRRTYTPHEIAAKMFSRLQDAYDPTSNDPNLSYDYTQEYSLAKLESIIIKSLSNVGMTEATESVMQRCLKAMGSLRRTSSKNVRYTAKEGEVFLISTRDRPADSASASQLRSTKTLFYTDDSAASLSPEQVEFYDEAIETDNGYKSRPTANPRDFKTPLALVIADSEPERLFLRALLERENIGAHAAWIKSTPNGFYEVEYHWKRGEVPHKNKFNPDFFIKVSDSLVLVVEIKSDAELREPSEENRKKNEFALAHFARINAHLEAQGNALRYKFNFLTPEDFNRYFQLLRDGQIEKYRSALDVALGDPTA